MSRYLVSTFFLTLCALLLAPASFGAEFNQYVDGIDGTRWGASPTLVQGITLDPDTSGDPRDRHYLRDRDKLESFAFFNNEFYYYASELAPGQAGEVEQTLKDLESRFPVEKRLVEHIQEDVRFIWKFKTATVELSANDVQVYNNAIDTKIQNDYYNLQGVTGLVEYIEGINGMPWASGPELLKDAEKHPGVSDREEEYALDGAKYRYVDGKLYAYTRPIESEDDLKRTASYLEDFLGYYYWVDKKDSPEKITWSFDTIEVILSKTDGTLVIAERSGLHLAAQSAQDNNPNKTGTQPDSTPEATQQAAPQPDQVDQPDNGNATE